jgi:hypothetical protein
VRHAYLIVASFVAMLLLGLSLATPSNAQNEAFEAAEQVPAGIHSVMTSGFWTLGKDEGFFRVVVVAGGVEHVSHRLYIQWLRSDAKTQGYDLIRTVNVKELNLGHGFVLEVKTSSGEINSFKIDITANGRGGKVKRFAITVKGDGKYAIRSR